MFFTEFGYAILEENDISFKVEQFLTEKNYPYEFAFSSTVSTEIVENYCLACFLPMSMNISEQIYFTPKLHIERCIVSTKKIHIKKTAQKDAKKYSLTINNCFNTVLDECVSTHGDGWLTKELTDTFKLLHQERNTRKVAFISFELWSTENQAQGTAKDKIEHNTQTSKNLIAGEIGYLIGQCYTSLTAFKKASGAGNVQLLATAGLLSENGIDLLDLGMPMTYKMSLGAQCFQRSEYIKTLLEAYSQKRPEDLCLCSQELAAQSLLLQLYP